MGVFKVRNFEIGQGEMNLAKVKEFYDEIVLVVQLLSFNDKRLRQFLPFCIIVVIIVTHFVPY